ncbi:MAG: cell division protein ZipA C-terminal FtsZ-binding domain-containing protein [Rhodocyclaceae bacterium]|nr:cell division protein ZipA C-terminal FtsZ-binding domain-containing protein [Rhodocyclaceae bacterium]
MSDLQIALIALGVALVAAVWFYNLWLEKKQRQRAAEMLPKAAPDVLMAGRSAKTEPAIGITNADAVQREPTFTAAEPFPEADEPPPAATLEVDFLLDDMADDARPATVPVPAEWSDGRADCLVRVEFVDAVPATALWTEHATWSATIDKPIQWLGLDERSQHWRTLLQQDSGAVVQLAAALQLVDRKGAVSPVTLMAFLDGMLRLSQRFAGLVELPVPTPLLSLADRLDAFCADVDLQLALHVLPAKTGEMAGAQLPPVIDADRLRLEGERFVAMDDTGAEAFALVCQSPTVFSAARLTDMSLTDLIFSLDVPRVAAGAAAFDRMIACARRCAEALGGQLADAHRKPLTDATIAAIRGRIQDLQRQMAEKDIPAGSVRALRLFS